MMVCVRLRSLARVDVEMGFGHGLGLDHGAYQFGVWEFAPELDRPPPTLLTSFNEDRWPSACLGLHG